MIGLAALNADLQPGRLDQQTLDVSPVRTNWNKLPKIIMIFWRIERIIVEFERRFPKGLIA